ncbi:MAG: LSU ribosomal protein L19p, partial [uncultured Thermomicrobiales bacterium]
GCATHPLGRIRAVQVRPAAVRRRRQRPGVGQGRRGHPRADPGLRGRRHPPPRRWRERELHGAPDRVPRGRRRADVPDPLAPDRQDRGRPARQGAPRSALLPARPDRARGTDQGAAAQAGPAHPL